mmetsp:Transcript_21258/g.54039  ORF Transcript_21258/g.54039 Transcript_21258/m.54039 type:complete len:390 (-) Transcript_21258:530-1699(-)
MLARLAHVALLEGLEDDVQLVLGDAAPRVHHLDHHVARAAVGVRLDADLALVRELGRVAHQVGQHLHQPPPVAHHGRQLLVHHLLHDHALARHGRDGAQHAVDHAAQVHHLLAQRDGRRARGLHEQDVVDNGQQVGRGGGDGLQPRLAALHHLAACAARQRVGQLDDGVEGGAQLVAHHRDEFVLARHCGRQLRHRLDALAVLALDLRAVPALRDGHVVVVHDGRGEHHLGGEVAENGERLAPHVQGGPGQARDDPGHPEQVPDDHGGSQREPQAGLGVEAGGLRQGRVDHAAQHVQHVREAHKAHQQRQPCDGPGQRGRHVAGDHHEPVAEQRGRDLQRRQVRDARQREDHGGRGAGPLDIARGQEEGAMRVVRNDGLPRDNQVVAVA